jgi:hypothetical protein
MGEINRLLFSIGTEEKKLLLFRPMAVTTDQRGNIYVLDFDDRAVKKFSTEGKYVMTFGYGKGKGPGEFSNPTDFDLGPDGSVWVCDPINGYVTVFNEHGRVEKTIRLENETPLRIAVWDDGSFVVTPAQSGKYLFSAYDRRGDLRKRFGNLFQNQAQIEIAIDGRLSKGREHLVYAFYRVGLFVIYEQRSTTPAVFAQTINYRGFPEIVRFKVGDSQVTRVDRKAPYAMLSLSIVGDEIHILIGDDGERNKSVFDVYDLKTGMYRSSYNVPRDISFAHITTERIYTIQDTTVQVWKR